MRGIQQAGIDNAEFEEAGDGIEGLQALASGAFDLVLSDVNMPNMNGLDFVKAAHQQCDPTPPIVMVTTEGSEEVIKEATTRGAKGHIEKPFTPENIQAIIGPYLQ